MSDPDIELWGGHECTVNRIGDVFHDQTRLSGHHERIADLDLFASLGVKKLRYPVLWERTAPTHPDILDFSWSDARLARIAQLGMSPIVGLLHHGSGPAYTSLIDPRFPAGLAKFGGAVAARYPDVLDWTPVNEPLTTARFSCLYGHWSPHRCDERTFWLALLNQIDGVRLAMAEIRKVQPRARLVQTEDLGRAYATPALTSQANFENDRRWLTWDLLSGSVTANHPLFERMAGFGLCDRLRAIADDPCPPDVIGVNHYLTSERFLDHRLERYPAHCAGGNAELRYADVEAIRVVTPPPSGLAGILQEAWDRYGRTLAVTEVHNGCTREDQLRWMREAWDTAQDLRRRGGKIEAVTAWALLGSYDWDSLLTVARGAYESGVFDVATGSPRPTALARFLSEGLEGAGVAVGAGWWRRDIRLRHIPSDAVGHVASVPVPSDRRGPDPPLLITGASGVLGAALARECDWRGLSYVLTDRRRLDLENPRRIYDALDDIRPWAVINAAGWVRVDDAETDEQACHAANAGGAGALAQACERRGIAVASFSTDLVFDGLLGRAYLEDDALAPLNAYGRSKADAERRVLEVSPRNLVIRTAAFFSPYDRHNFAAHVTADLELGREFSAADDLTVSPTYVPDLARAVLDLVIDREAGIWHLANAGAVTWAQFARQVAIAHGLDVSLIRAQPAALFGWPAPRPRAVPLASSRGKLMPTFYDAVARYAAEWLKISERPPAA